jgi:diguanylate cyclase (GGDEF)-like protein
VPSEHRLQARQSEKYRDRPLDRSVQLARAWSNPPERFESSRPDDPRHLEAVEGKSGVLPTIRLAFGEMAGSDDSYDESTRQIAAAELRKHLSDSEEDRAQVTCVTEPRLGRSFPLKAGSNVIGRTLDAEICLPASTVSRRHAEIAVAEGRHILTDAGSTNGTVCNGERVVGPVPLKHGSRIVLGGDVILVFSIEDAIERRMRSKLYEIATRDPLTNAYNRRFFSERLESEWPWAVRHAQSCALVVLDLDHFKRVNDTWGHSAGDHVLEELALLIAPVIRREDVFARLGGEEFAILCRVTDRKQATALAERLRVDVETHEFRWRNDRIPITVSIGVATSEEPTVQSAEDLLRRADERLYAAKAAGRNRVCWTGP